MSVTLRSSLLECQQLKQLRRSGWVHAGIACPESVAAHSWGVAWLVLALRPPGLDLARALALAVIHDLAEVRTGDLTPADGVPASVRHACERQAFAALIAPLAQHTALAELLDEYQLASTAEARFVKACDKLDMALQAAAYAQAGDLTSDASAEFIASAVAGIEPPSLQALADPGRPSGLALP
jgi:putative hydrolase of HD superfamily